MPNSTYLFICMFESVSRKRMYVTSKAQKAFLNRPFWFWTSEIWLESSKDIKRLKHLCLTLSSCNDKKFEYFHS